MNDFINLHLCVPYQAPKRILVVARCQREADAYMKTLPKEQHKLARYAFGPQHFYGHSTKDVVCHLIGHYWEHRDYQHFMDLIRVRGYEYKEVFHWR